MTRAETQLLLQLSKDIKDDLKTLSDRLDDHLTKDEIAWKKVEKIDGQLGGIKWMLGSIMTAIGLALAWLGLRP